MCMTAVIGFLAVWAATVKQQAGMSMIAVCSDLTWEMINFREVFNEVWWSGVGSLFNVSGETCCNVTHVAVRFYRRWINPINQTTK